MRTQIAGLGPGAGCFVFPSLESALVETLATLADRDRETGGARTSVVYGLGMDPALDAMATAASSAGLDVRALPISDLSDTSKWLGELKSKCLLAAWTSDDRFRGVVRETAAIAKDVLADGVRVPGFRISFESNSWMKASPRPFEVQFFQLNNGAVIMISGDRLKLPPRVAPYLVSVEMLREIETLITKTPVAIANEANVKAAIESFESRLPTPFRSARELTDVRLFDRTVFTSSEIDGSFAVMSLGDSLSAKRELLPLVISSLASMSGCFESDPKRQEWLRARGEDAWAIRGTVVIGADLFMRLSVDEWLGALSAAHATYKKLSDALVRTTN